MTRSKRDLVSEVFRLDEENRALKKEILDTLRFILVTASWAQRAPIEEKIAELVSAGWDS